MALNKELQISQGKTFSQVLRWEAPPIVYKSITAMTNSAPVRITVPSHGLPDGWRVAITSVKGMTQINAASPLKDKDYHTVTVIDADTIEVNDINSLDFRPYISGGVVQFNTPVDLTDYTARMSIKDKVGGTELLRLDTDNGRIVVDNTAKMITLLISAADTELIEWKKGVYDLEMVSGGTVVALLAGQIFVTKEVTTS